MAATWSIQTPTATPGAIGVVQVAAESGEALEAVLRRLGIGTVAVGGIGLRDLCGVDRGIVARWTAESAHLMPHAGPAVLRGLAAALERAGIPERGLDPCRTYPEAGSLVEARMLGALARAASPLAIDLLLAQPERWGAGAGAETDAARDRALRRLIDPALVVAIGAPNIGKSSLVNALAGRRVALVADEPGTTRDHVGVLLDAGGLVIRYVDTPGIRAAADSIEAEAATIAGRLVGAADLVLRCGDATAPPPDGPGRSVVVATRADLGLPGWRADAATSARTGEGLEALVGAIRERLVPAAFLADPAPWRFWEG